MLRDGFDYTEWFVRRVNEGEADLKAGRVLSTTALLTSSRANLRRLRGLIVLDQGRLVSHIVKA